MIDYDKLNTEIQAEIDQYMNYADRGEVAIAASWYKAGYVSGYERMREEAPHDSECEIIGERPGHHIYGPLECNCWKDGA